ncbi:Drebrin-like protein [Pleurostoma richardsiae]|uniref:Drebrin-like protein n=1 Tax=Pleurostoma richardsiae TaxID=41990 RepID=A0AA38S7D3_9PEZI|nr:Drebrin-like protein [Pleurostoma richardsiae]
MASLNLSINGPSIKSSYQAVVNGPAPSSGSPTYGHWALFSVQAPLLNAFQDSGAKESILKVETTGEGELDELIEDFNEGRIQFAFVKVKDPNTGLPKNVLIAWCGGGVPERTKGYFTSHLAAVAKVLHGYHVQITARSDSDLEPASIIQKVSDASGAKYTAGGSAPSPAHIAAPPVAKKPVFTPTASSSGGSFNPLLAARSRRNDNVDDDGWGADAPPVTRTELEKVESAYKPTKVNLAELTKQHHEPSRFNGSTKQDDRPSDVIGGGYQPVGKVDIAAIRAAAQRKEDDRPTPVKGSYEPVGKVDIAAIRARAQKPVDEEPAPAPKSLAERSAAFSQPAQSERLTSLPKPKVANKFGSGGFTGTKAPTPAGLGLGSPAPPPPVVGTASRTFADQGGKTPAQLWAERKARESGASTTASPPPTSPVTAQKSGSEWKSGYSGKSWAPVQAAGFSRSVTGHKTGETDRSTEEVPSSPSGGVSALRDRFKEAPPMGAAASSIPKVPTGASDSDRAPPPPPESSRPAGGFALPGLPVRPPPPTDEEEEESEIPAREPSPIRVAVPVPRGPEPEIEPPAERSLPTPIPVPQIEHDLPKEEELPEEPETHDPRGAATAVAEHSFGQDAVEESQTATTGGKKALVQYDYDKAEDNEIDLKEGEYVTNIDMVDDDWWMGTNTKGESGLFPSNYVELVDDNAAPAAPAAPAASEAGVPPPPPAAEPEPEPAHAAAGSPTATALFDYEAAEDNELSFPEGATVTNLEFPDEDWWFGHYGGKSGLFPANYVQLDS